MTFKRDLYKLQNALYVYNMNRFKPNVKPEIKDKHLRDVIDCALKVGLHLPPGVNND